MSFLKNIFRNHKKEQHDITAEAHINSAPKTKLSINQLEFTQLSEEEIEKKWTMMTDEKTPEEDKPRLRREILPSCSMSQLADNGVILYRMAKSSDDIAKKSIEHWKQIEHKPHSVVEANPNGHGMSLTTAEALILCLPYGDMVTEVVFDNDRLKANNMEDQKVYKVGHLFDEYIATKILTGGMYSIANPETLKKVIDLSSDSAFEKALMTKSGDALSINDALKKFGFENSLTYWERIQDRYVELKNMNAQNKIGILRIELNELLQSTPFVGNDVFNGNEPVNLTTNTDERDKEI